MDRLVSSSRRAADLGVLAVGLALVGAAGLAGRVYAWPEILVPSYLIPRGFVLYRDIKFAHTPLLIQSLALLLGAAGFRAGAIRAAAAAPAIAAVGLLWIELRRRRASLAAMSLAIPFVAITFSLFQAIAIYPDVAVAALSLPIFLAATGEDERSWRRAGWLLGICLAMKQTCFLALLVVLAAVFVRRGARPAAGLLLRAATPLAICTIPIFAGGASLAEILRWTVAVPLFVYRGRTSLAPTGAQLLALAPAILPWAAWAAPGDGAGGRKSAAFGSALLIAFAALAIPKFEFLHLAATIPILGWMAAGAVDSRPRTLRATVVLVAVVVNGLALSTAASPGGIAFWDSPQIDRTVVWLATQRPAPIFLYGVEQNLFIRAGRLPPGGLYNNPDLWYHYAAERLERRQISILSDTPGTIVLKGREVRTGDVGNELADFLRDRFRSSEVVAPGIVRLVRSPAAALP